MGEPAAAHTRRERGTAMARRRGLFTDFRDSVVDRPDVSRSECMSANAHFSIFVKPFMRTQAVRDSPRKTVSIDGFGGLPANFEYVPHPALHAPRLCTSTSCNESQTLASRDCGHVLERSRILAREMNVGAISWGAGMMATIPSASLTLGNRG